MGGALLQHCPLRGCPQPLGYRLAYPPTVPTLLICLPVCRYTVNLTQPQGLFQALQLYGTVAITIYGDGCVCADALVCVLPAPVLTPPHPPPPCTARLPAATMRCTRTLRASTPRWSPLMRTRTMPSRWWATPTCGSTPPPPCPSGSSRTGTPAGAGLGGGGWMGVWEYRA